MRKTMIIWCAAALLLLGFTGSVSAATRESSDYFIKPQIGVWFGPVTPVYTLWNEVDTALGGGGYVRINTPARLPKIGFDASYQKHESKGVNGLMLVPTYGNLVFRLPFDFPVIFQLKLGAGASYVHIWPDNRGQFDPLFMAGWEMAFPAGNFVNIGLRIDYLYLYERHISGASRDGHVINAGLTLYFNLNLM